MNIKLKDLIAPFAVWKRAFEKPYTVKKPIDERPGSRRYRGFHKNDIDLCIGCGTCEEICQNAAIDLVPLAGIETAEGDSGLRPRIDYGRCCWCALCVDICPTSSMGMSNEYIWIDTDPDVFRFVAGGEKKPWDSREQGYRRPDGYRLLDPARAPMEILPAAQSLTGFMEIVKGFSREQARKEADRCIECGICVATCPAHMDIPGYIRAVREGNMEEGLKLLYETNPFPAVCGRVCTHRCEEVCAVGHTGDPIAIRWLKRYIADQFEIDAYQKVLPRPLTDTGKRIAVIGTGPGGLSAAYYLRMLGYEATVFERALEGGGMLRYGIPEYRLPYDQLDKDIAYITELGVEIRYGTAVGKDIPFSRLDEDFDAVFFSTGLPASYTLGVAGEDHQRVIDGITLLETVTRGEDPGIGKKVAVVGGGNVAMDAARSCRRLGADVTVLYRRRQEDMPADEEEILEAIDEGVHLITRAIPIGVEDPSTDGQGQVVFVWGKAEMIDPGDGGRPRPELIPGSQERFYCDTLIPAIGQGPDLSFLPEDSGVRIKRYKVLTDTGRRSGEGKIFAGGDIVNPRRDAISAVADGHAAARGIDAYLQGAQT